MSRLMASAALVLTVLAGSRTASAQTIDPAFRADIERLLSVSGAAAMGAQMASLVSNSVIDSMQKANPTMPPRAAALVKEVLNAEFGKAFEPNGELMSRLVVIYANRFSRADVAALLAFYESDIGKKMVALAPTLAQEGAGVGQQWAAQNMPRVMGVLQQRLRDEGLIK